MGFYSPAWVRTLAKEDADAIVKHVNQKGKDFRSYIDANIPFVLWLDINLIRERILNKADPFISELALAISNNTKEDMDLPNKIKKLFDEAYQDTINSFASNPRYEKIGTEELNTLLDSLSNAPLGEVKRVINTRFKITKIVTNVTKPNKSVMLIFPKFRTLEFGAEFKKSLKKVSQNINWLSDSKPEKPAGPFGVLAQGTGYLSQKEKFLAFVNENFSKLQNIGHIEVDVISEEEKVVKRGQNSPRLLQALMTLPKDVQQFERLQYKFSKETGQAETRIKIRKRFKGSKLIFELLVEHGISVGIPESQKDNLRKAALEQAFTIGKGFSASIRRNPNILTNIETSKSFKQFIVDNYISLLETGKSLTYNSDTTINAKQSLTVNKAQIITPSITSGTKGLTKISPLRISSGLEKAKFINLISLQSLINASLHDQIQKNMGKGERTDVLNYQTGRFARSAEVTRMTLSREGAITAFYSYMKNPYATFSEGGQQSRPRTRDPKLLISKSIREIAASRVANRLRAVVT